MSNDMWRTAVGFVLILAILLLWQVLWRPRTVSVPHPQAGTEQVESTEVAVAEEPAPAEVFRPKTVVQLSSAVERETTYVLENEHLRLEFTNRGGALKSVWLKRYRAEMVPEGGALLAATLWRGTDTIDLSNVILESVADDSSVSFSLVTDDLSFRRRFVLGQDYILTLRTWLAAADGFVVSAADGIAVTEPNVKDDLSHFHFFARAERKVQRIAARGCKTPQNVANTDWVGLKSKYFFLVVAAGKQGVKDSKSGFSSACAWALPDGRIGFAAGVEGAESELMLYLGPVEYSRLRAFGRGLEEAVSLGWAKPVALGILYLLRFLYSVFRNWGVAIVVFSILMKAIFFPLTRTQTRQMRQMQLLQPKLNELKAKYKNDPQTLNQETMQLYKLYRINPLAGCLPMLVQLPVFWALYSVLRTFVDLRGASFVLWLKDLSEPDTLFGHLPFLGHPAIGLLPILMGASFIAQNLLTSTDKKNWAMTVIFPLFITVMFLNFPSGLQLYWFTYNVLSILESVFGMKGGIKWLSKKTASS